MFTKSRTFVLIGLLLLAFVVAACGEKEVVVEKEVIREVEVEKPVIVEKEVVKEIVIEKPVVVEKEVVKEVIKEVVVEREVLVTAVPMAVIDEVPFARVNAAALAKFEDGVFGGTLKVAKAGTIDSLDPQLAVAEGIRWTIMMYDGAVTRDRAYTTTVGYDEPLVPRMYGIAKSIRWEGDSTLVFEFEEGAKFHDGTPFNAEAALFGYRRMWDPTFEYYFPAAGAARADIGSLVADNGAAMETLGEYTLAITLKQRSWDFLDWMSMMGQYDFPSPAAVKEFGNESIGSNPVGTGPFKFVEWEPNVRLVVEANGDYWQGRPFLDEIIMVPIPDAGARMAAILSGEVDMAHGVRAEWVDQLQDDPDITLHVRGRAEVLNMRPSYFIEENPLNDEKLRVALNMAIDREGLANVVLGGTAYPAGTFSSPSASTYDPSANVVVPYDLDEAARLLADAGYPGGEGLPVLNMLVPATGCGTDTLAISEYVQSTWSEIGVELNLEVLEFNSMLGRWFTGGTNEANADTHLNILCHGLDSPFRIKMEYSIEKWTPNGWNASHYYNPETEAWLDKMSAARNYTDYIGFAQKAEAVATAETSDFWTVHAAKPLAVHKKIKGWKPAREWSDLYTKLWIEE